MKDTNIKNLVKPSVRSLTAYHAIERPCKIKLDANESPYGFSAGTLAKIATNRYPDSEAKELRKLLAKRLVVSPANILFGNGSDEIIYCLIAAFGGPVLFPVPTFSMYGIISQALGEKSISIPLDREFDIDLGKTLMAIKKGRPKLIFLSSPNNPTGNCFSSDRLLKIIDSARSPEHSALVVVDEAYQPFSGRKGFLPLLKDYKNVAIMRTLSKIGLAALRLGFLIADAEIIAEVNKVRLPFNVNSFSQAIALQALKDKNWVAASAKKIILERERLFKEMGKIEGVKLFPSEANFILFGVKGADKVYRMLLKKSILVKNFNGSIKGCLRVTVGTPEENNIFLKALGEVAYLS